MFYRLGKCEEWKKNAENSFKTDLAPVDFLTKKRSGNMLFFTVSSLRKTWLSNYRSSHSQILFK